MTASLWAGVILLGGLGAALRVLTHRWVSSRAGPRIPFGTFAVNQSGAALLGVLTGLAPGNDLTLLLGTAALGSYTTFSTWMLESHELAGRDGRLSALNVSVSLLLGFGAIVAGRALGASL